MASIKAIDHFDEIRKTIGPATAATSAEDMRWHLLSTGLIELTMELDKLVRTIATMREESSKGNVYR